MRWLALVPLLAAAAAAARTTPPSSPATQAHYDRLCLPCHGPGGHGDGPAAAFLWPRPRDFTRGQYRWRSTPSGMPATVDDLVRTIDRGVPGTSMPGFTGVLTPGEEADLARHLLALGPARAAGRAVAAPPAPADLASRATAGAALWDKAGCAACHGATGKGDGPAAASLVDDAGRPHPPYDLTREPLRRPDGLYLSLRTGLDGAAMPAYQLPADDLWALVAHVQALNASAQPPDGRLHLPASTGDSLSVRTGLQPAPQGTPPASLPPAAQSLSADQCARCHPHQATDWRASLHARTMGPGTMGQLRTAGLTTVRACQRCHAPLAEQLPGGDAALRSEGATCAGCHVRNFARLGPPPLPDSRLLAIPGYPLTVDAVFERSDVCLPCHQLGIDDAINGRPILDTYREWLTGPYMARGVQCQHCHMPERAHTWKGVHDPDTVRQGLRVELDRRSLSLTNVGAGHMLPTTTTPYLVVELAYLDDKGKVLGTSQSRIGRELVFEHDVFVERADTRIAPGEQRVILLAPPAGASRARLTITVHPDGYYEGFYARALRRPLDEASRKDLEAALAAARQSAYVLTTQEVRW